jgi:hypothetical protein
VVWLRWNKVQFVLTNLNGVAVSGSDRVHSKLSAVRLFTHGLGVAFKHELASSFKHAHTLTDHTPSSPGLVASDLKGR